MSFDANKAVPVAAFRLVSLAPTLLEHKLLFVISHVVSDLQAVGNLTNEVILYCDRLAHARKASPETALSELIIDELPAMPCPVQYVEHFESK